MRQGLNVVDVDTHVNPRLSVLLRYADKDLLDRADDLKQYTRGEGDEASLTVAPVRYNRVAGTKDDTPTEIKAGGAKNLAGRTKMQTRKPVSEGVADDNAAGRLADMDEEGSDINFLIAGTWAYAAPTLSRELMWGLYRAYHRYMADYCSADARRLKGHIIAPGNDPEQAARTINELAEEDWVAAVWPTLPVDLPIDDPDLDPIWAAANDAGLPIMYHGFTVEPPYYPGYRDIWNNAAMSRAAGQPWGGQRFLAFMMISGILDRYPNLRIGTHECGHGWLPHWLQRIERQVHYVSGAVPDDLQSTPTEYLQAGRVFCGVDAWEGPEMTRAVVDLLGPNVLMYMSDYPHAETMFPDTVDTVLSWQDVLGAEATRRLIGENAMSYLRLSTTPWESPTVASTSPATA